MAGESPLRLYHPEINHAKSEALRPAVKPVDGLVWRCAACAATPAQS
jgi:hypothetical protein